MIFGGKLMCATLAHCAPKDRVLNAVNSSQLPINQNLLSEKPAAQQSTVRAQIEAWLNQQWYGVQAPALILRALVPLYKSLRWLDAIRLRSKAAATNDKVLPPIIVVGNLTVGGSG